MLNLIISEKPAISLDTKHDFNLLFYILLLTGYIISANHQPRDFGSVSIPGYYNIADREKRLEYMIKQKEKRWILEDFKRLQLDTKSLSALQIKKVLYRFLKQFQINMITPF